MMLIEDAEIIRLLGVNMYAWGLHAALGCALCLICLAVCEKKAGLPKGGAALVSLCMLLCGAVLSRLFFVLFDGSMRSSLTLKGILYIQGGGFSMYGALMGAFAGAYLAGRVLKTPFLRLADVLFPALMLFIAVTRMGERFTEIGISRPLLNAPEVKGAVSWFVTVGDYDLYLSTYVLEAAAALACLVLFLADKRRRHAPGMSALMGMLVFGCMQTWLESLRFDQHMKFSFVGVQQVLSVLLMMGMVVYFGVCALKKGRGKRLFTLSCGYLAVLTGAVIGLEFLIDRSGLSRLMLYGVYAVLLLVPCIPGGKLRALAEKE